MIFFITENMMGSDLTAIKRCYDLKGSLHNRITKIDDYDRATGITGLKVLKDQNLQNDGKLDLNPNEKE